MDTFKLNKCSVYQHRLWQAVACAAIVVTAAMAGAWSTDSDVGVALCQSTGLKGNIQAVSDGAGGQIFVWEDSRNGAPDIYAQRVTSAGELLWGADGASVCAAVNYQSRPRAVSDGAGGVIVAWNDLRSGSATNLFAQRLNPQGVSLWQVDGITVATSPAFGGRHFEAVSDGAGGIIISYEGYPTSVDSINRPYDILAQRITSSGALAWPANGVLVCGADNYQQFVNAASDGQNGAIITWQDNRTTGIIRAYAQRVTASGTAAWRSNGVPVSAVADKQGPPEICSDNAGGAYILWSDVTGSDITGGGFQDLYDLHVQRLNGSCHLPGRNRSVRPCVSC